MDGDRVVQEEWIEPRVFHVVRGGRGCGDGGFGGCSAAVVSSSIPACQLDITVYCFGTLIMKERQPEPVKLLNTIAASVPLDITVYCFFLVT